MSIEQQPEAWIVINKETGFRTQVASIAPFMYEKDMFEVIPLYTSPPKRNPLSYEHLEALADEFEGCPMTLGRAVEMAHGIGGGE
jgi:hypothetical protein